MNTTSILLRSSVLTVAACTLTLLPVCHAASTNTPVRLSVLDQSKLQASSCSTPSPNIAKYESLQQKAPHLFKDIGDVRHGEIALLLGQQDMCETQDSMFQLYRKTMKDQDAWDASRAGVILSDPYFIVLRDVVRFPNGKRGLYDRKVTRATLDGGVAGAFCLPLLADGRVVLVKEYRHQERAWRLSIPGGFRDKGESSEEAARREASEETKLTIADVSLLGHVDAEGENVPLFLGQVSLTGTTKYHADEGEAISGTITLTLQELRKVVVESGYRDSEGHWLFVHGNLGTALLMAEHFLDRRP